MCFCAVFLMAISGLTGRRPDERPIHSIAPTAPQTLSVTLTVIATATAQPKPTSPQIVVVIATPVAVPTPAVSIIDKYGSQIATGIVSLVAGVLITLLFPAILKYGKQSAIWFYTKLHIERQLHQHYCQSLAGDLRKVKILGMVKPRDLEQIFVPLKIREYVQWDGPTQGSKDQSHILTFDEALTLFPAIIVLGDPGAGKTTLAKHATVLCAERKFRIGKRTYLPIYIPLDESMPALRGNENEPKEFEKFLAEILKTYGFPDAEDFLVRHLKRGDCLILLDGFDELASDDDKEMVALKVRNLARSYSDGNRIVLTSREAGFRGSLFARFATLEIADLPFEQALVFVNRWFIGQSTKADKLIRILRDNRRLQLIANNPLMLAVICISFEHKENLPQRRADLYEECLDTLMQLWDKSRGVDRKPVFSPEQKEAVLRRVAFDFHDARKTDFSLNELLASIRKYMPAASEKRYRDDDFMDEILEHTGIIRQKARDTYTFQHLTFQEFLAAQLLADDMNWGTSFIVAHVEDPWWSEPITLTAGILRDATQLIEDIYERKGKNLSDDMCLLLARCLTDADLSNSELKDEILSRVVLLATAKEEVG